MDVRRTQEGDPVTSDTLIEGDSIHLIFHKHITHSLVHTHKRQNLVDLLHTKLQAPPPDVSVGVFLEDTKVKAKAAGDLAVSQMTGGHGPLTTKSAESIDPTVIDITTRISFHSQS